MKIGPFSPKFWIFPGFAVFDRQIKFRMDFQAYHTKFPSVMSNLWKFQRLILHTATLGASQNVQVIKNTLYFYFRILNDNHAMTWCTSVLQSFRNTRQLHTITLLQFLTAYARKILMYWESCETLRTDLTQAHCVFCRLGFGFLLLNQQLVIFFSLYMTSYEKNCKSVHTIESTYFTTF